jgi:hypothetical protein
VKLASLVTSLSSAPNFSTIIFLTLSAIVAIFLLFIFWFLKNVTAKLNFFLVKLLFNERKRHFDGFIVIF